MFYTGGICCSLKNGTVVTWGKEEYGGDCSKVKVALRGVQKIFSTLGTLAPVSKDGTVVT